MEYMTVKEAAEKWKISQRRVNALCSEGRIDGAKRLGWVWAIPVNAEKPEKLPSGPKKGKVINDE